MSRFFSGLSQLFVPFFLLFVFFFAILNYSDARAFTAKVVNNVSKSAWN